MRAGKGSARAALGRLARALPGAEEGTSYGTPAWRVAGRLFARARKDGKSLVLRMERDERDMLIAANPRVFHITEHYRNHPAVLVSLDAVTPGELGNLLERSWRMMATKRLVAELEARLSPPGKRN